MAVDQIYSCSRNHEFVYLITFHIGEEQKKYYVCKECSKLDHFKKFVINKASFTSMEIN